MGDQDNPLKDVVAAQPKKLSPESDEKRAPIDVISALRLIDGLAVGNQHLDVGFGDSRRIAFE